MFSWVTVVPTLFGGIIGLTYLIYSGTMDLSIRKLSLWGAYFLPSAILVCMELSFRTQLGNALWTLCIFFVPVMVVRFIHSQASGKPSDNGIMLSAISGGLAGIGLVSFCHYIIVKFEL